MTSISKEFNIYSTIKFIIINSNSKIHKSNKLKVEIKVCRKLKDLHEKGSSKLPSLKMKRSVRFTIKFY